MNKDPMLSIKEAAALLNVDKKSIKERLANGQLNGEKRLVGDREKWFVDHKSVERTLAGRRVYASIKRPVASPPVSTRPDMPQTHVKEVSEGARDNRTSTAIIIATAVDDIFSQESEKRLSPDDAARGDWLPEQREKMEALIEAAVSDKMLQPLLERLTSEAARQICLISEAAARELEIERQKANRLEDRIFELHQSKVEMETHLNVEIEKLRAEREEMALATQQQLDALKEKMVQVERPWWKKLFP